LPPENVATHFYDFGGSSIGIREQVAVHPKRNCRGSVAKPAADGQDMLMWNISPSAADSLFNWSNVILIVGAGSIAWYYRLNKVCGH